MWLDSCFRGWQRRRLCRLLEKAAAQLAPLEGSIYSSYASGQEMAAFVRQCKQGIESGTIDKAQKYELWCMFAPTCDWDDVGGSLGLGNGIFALLNALYGREIKSSGS